MGQLKENPWAHVVHSGENCKDRKWLMFRKHWLRRFAISLYFKPFVSLNIMQPISYFNFVLNILNSTGMERNTDPASVW